MGIQDIILKNSEEFARIMASLLKSKTALHWDKALQIIYKNQNESLWQEIENGNFPQEINQLEIIEFLIRLKFHELDILKIMGKDVSINQKNLIKVISRFTSIQPENYYFELEGMKQQLIAAT